MAALTLDRTEELIARWLDDTVALDDPENPAGTLYLGGKHVEYDITATGTGPIGSSTVTGCGMCTGSICNGRRIQCF